MHGPHFYPSDKTVVPTGATGVLWLAHHSNGPIRVVQHCNLRRCMASRAKQGLLWFWYEIVSSRAAHRIVKEEKADRGLILWPNGRKPVSLF